MMKILKWIWQNPQNIIGFLWSRPYKAVSTYKMEDGTEVKVYYTDNVAGCGVSLGQYIIFDYKNYYGKNTYTNVYHEYGHTLQSELLGPFYFIRIGIISAVRNLIDRWFHKKWTVRDRVNWYYKTGPFSLVEHSADLMGGVKR